MATKNTLDHSITAKTRYNKLESDRKPYTDRAEKCAVLTIPMAFPKDSDTSSSKYDTPYQSIGARGVNNLTSKLMLALFPPNEPCFRLSLGEEITQQLKQSQAKQQEYEAALARIERIITQYMETHQIRATGFEAALQLVIAGNALLFLPPAEGGMRMYRLSSYVLQRDGMGTVLEIIVKENISYGALPKEALACIEQDNVDADKNFEVYTHTKLQGDVYLSYQEIEGKVVQGSEQSYPKDKSPWIAVRLKKMDGESYGRSFVDEYYGDLKSLEALSKAIAQVAAVASNIIYLVNPNSTLRISKLSEASSGDFVKGKRDDITALQLDKSVDMQTTFTASQQIEGRLSYAFLLNSAVQRNAVRVTAEEIRYVANELEDTIGGIYSILSQELQLPLIKRLITQLTMQGVIPDMPMGSNGVEPQITTGLEALGRGHDLTKLDTFLQYAKLFPQDFSQRVKIGEVLNLVATAAGLGASTFIKTDEELAQEQQAAQEQQMAQNVAPQIAQGAMRQ